MSAKEVRINLPVNLKEEEHYLFPERSYDIEVPKVFHYRNVLATKSGICMKGFKILKPSIHAYKHLYWQFFKVGLANALLRKKIKLPQGKYLLIHNVWSRGYYHWVCEALPRLWQVKNNTEEYTLLLPESAKSGQLESLEAFRFKEIIHFPSSANFIVPGLCLPENPAKVYEPDPTVCDAIREFYHKQLTVELIQKFNFGQRIYASRRKAKSRKVANEEAIMEVLDGFGFKVICFEDYSFFEQVAIMYHARVFISIHGAGLTNMHFMQAGGSVLELYKRRVPKVDYGRVRQSDMPSPCYCRLASALDHRHYIQFCEAIDASQPAGQADLIVNMAELKNNIKSYLQ